MCRVLSTEFWRNQWPFGRNTKLTGQGKELGLISLKGKKRQEEELKIFKWGKRLPQSY